MSETIHATRILTGIDSRSWEHPADRATLNALRKVPGFDQVLRAVFGFLGDRQIRLVFQANAVRVSETQFPRVHRLYREACATLDVEEHPLFVRQDPTLNAGAYGVGKPFIVVNSALVSVLDDRQLKFVLGHELGHVMSGHVLYNTMIFILFRLASMGFPLLELAARAVLVALLEWSRKAELSADRAGILAVQDPQPAMETMLVFAGGATGEAQLGEFIHQADEYRQSEDLVDQVFKIFNVLGMTHPFPVIRVAEMRNWFESGAYDRILRGEYRRRGEPDPAYQEDVAEAAKAYASDSKESFGGAFQQASDAARKVVDSFRSGFTRG